MPPKRTVAPKPRATPANTSSQKEKSQLPLLPEEGQQLGTATPKPATRYTSHFLKEIILAKPTTNDLDFELRAQQILLAKASSSAQSSSAPSAIRGAGLSVLSSGNLSSAGVSHLPSEPQFQVSSLGAACIEGDLSSLGKVGLSAAPAVKSSAIASKDTIARMLQGFSGRNPIADGPAQQKPTYQLTSSRPSFTSPELAPRKASASNVASIIPYRELQGMAEIAKFLPSISHSLFLYANLYWTQIGGAAGARWSNTTSGLTSASSSQPLSQPPVSKIRSVPVDEKMLLAVSPRCGMNITRNHVEYVCKVFPYFFEVKWVLPTPRLYFNHFYKAAQGGAAGEAVPTISEFHDYMLGRFKDPEDVAKSVIAVSSHELGKREQEAALAANKENHIPEQVNTPPSNQSGNIRSSSSSGLISSSNLSQLFPQANKRRRSASGRGDSSSDEDREEDPIAKKLLRPETIMRAPPSINPSLLSVLSDEKRRQVEAAMIVEDLFKNQNLSETLQNKINMDRLLACFDLIFTLFHNDVAGQGAAHVGGSRSIKSFIYGHALVHQLHTQNAFSDSEEIVRKQLTTLIGLGAQGSGLYLNVDPCQQLLSAPIGSSATSIPPLPPSTDLQADEDDKPSHLRRQDTPETIINGISLDRGIVVLDRSAVDRKALATAISKLA